jgi:predicted AAA+ superfamily ATPase
VVEITFFAQITWTFLRKKAKIDPMERKIQKQLDIWKASSRRKPLILQGARQVGKTHALKEFGRRSFAKTIYLNFEEDSALSEIFSGKLSAHHLMEQISLYTGQEVTPTTLLILDEIQVCENALTSLKYFQEEVSEYFIAAAGSLLGVKLAHSKSFPVGKVNFLSLYPMSFSEFLLAVGEGKLFETLEDSTNLLSAGAVHEKLLNLFKQYLLVGGMPEAVASYVQKKDFKEIREIHHEILRSYELDFAKYSNHFNSLKIASIWNSLPAQLSRENKKFKLSEIKSSARYREYEVALQWLIDAGLVLQSRWISSSKLPLVTYADSSMFKLYLLDVGLLSTKMQLHPKILLDEHLLFQEAKGALVENYVAQELTVSFEKPLLYWSNENRAEVDFVFQHEDQVFPMEVKSGNTSHKKSLNIYGEKFHPKLSIRWSPQPTKRQKDFINLSFYDVARFLRLVES